MSNDKFTTESLPSAVMEVWRIQFTQELYYLYKLRREIYEVYYRDFKFMPVITDRIEALEKALFTEAQQ